MITNYVNIWCKESNNVYKFTDETTETEARNIAQKMEIAKKKTEFYTKKYANILQNKKINIKYPQKHYIKPIEFVMMPDIDLIKEIKLCLF